MITEGICPACEEPGLVATPCQRDACRRRGRHCIPAEYAPPADEPLDGYVGQKWGDYLLVRKLGAGGVGAVYLALQCPLLMETALKLFTDTDSALGGRFESEASALARLRHPNIVRLLHYGLHADRPFLVMEYVPGGRTLGDVMATGLSSADAVDIIRQAALGLESAHLVDIVHRDIKPANIMIQSLPGQAHYVRLVDFGLAKFVDAGSSTQMMAGTPNYMAPEQLTRRNIGPWTDWYALGAITFELLTGRRPFVAESIKQMLLLKSDPDFDPTAQLVGLGLPRGLIAFLKSVVAHDPRARPQNGPTFIQGLTAAVAGLDQGPTALLGAHSATRAEATSAEMAGEAHPPRTREGSRGGTWVFPAVAIAVGLALGGGYLALTGSQEASPAAPAVANAAAVTAAADTPPAPTAEIEVPANAPHTDAELFGLVSLDAGPPDAAPDAAPADAGIPLRRPQPERSKPAPQSKRIKPTPGGATRTRVRATPRSDDSKPKPTPRFKVPGLSVPGMK